MTTPPVVGETRCAFDEGWYRGQCRKDASGDGPYCAEHAAERCRACGAQATYWCGHATAFACGTSRCDTCDCPHLDGDAPGSHGWKWGKLEQNAMSGEEVEAIRLANYEALRRAETQEAADLP